MLSKAKRFIVVSVLLATLLVGGTAGIAMADDGTSEAGSGNRPNLQGMVSEYLGISVEELQSASTEAHNVVREQDIEDLEERREGFHEAINSILYEWYGIEEGTLAEALEAVKETIHENIEARKEGMREQLEARKAEMRTQLEARKAEMREQLEARKIDLQEKIAARKAEMQAKRETRKAEMQVQHTERQAQRQENHSNIGNGTSDNGTIY